MTSLLDALIQVESSGIPGRRGPHTKYGQPVGLGQTLPATAREMALKLGLPWRPDLLTAPTPEGAEYQRKVSEAYLAQGMERTGNERDALRYYHGGPDRRLWGPKTNAYADKVMGLAQGGEQSPAPQMEAQPSMIQDTPLGIDQNEPTGLAGILQANPASIVGNARPLDPGKPHMFGKGGTGWLLAGIIADALAGLGGRQGGFAPTYLQGQEDDRRDQLWREKVANDRAERLDAANLDLQKGLALQDARNAHPTPGALEKNIEYLRQLNPNLNDAQLAAIAQRYMNRPIMIGGQPFGYEDGGDTGDGGPQPGMVEDGFVFMGGDPADQSNWRPQ